MLASYNWSTFYFVISDWWVSLRSLSGLVFILYCTSVFHLFPSPLVFNTCVSHFCSLTLTLTHAHTHTHTHTQHQFIAQCMTEIKKELKQDNVNIKANAVSKLTYVSLNHFSWLYLVGVSLSEFHTSVTALWKCVCVCSFAWTDHFP